MRMRSRAVAVLATAAAAALVLPSCTQAAEDTFPSEDITLVVPYDAGGGTDAIARALQPYLEEELGATLLVENRPGGSGAVGTNEVLAAAPDGHTMLMVAASPTVATPLFNDVGYVPEDIDVVGLAVPSPDVIIVTPDSPYQSAEEFFDAAEAGESIRVGVPGSTSMQTIALDLINAELGTDIVGVPFDGAAGSVAALQAGDVDAAFSTVPDVASFLQSSDAEIIAATMPDDVPESLGTEVPSLEDQGVHPPAAANWYGLGGPSGLPEDVVDAWAAAIEAALQEEDVIASLADIGMEPGFLPPAEFRDYIDAAWAVHSELDLS